MKQVLLGPKQVSGPKCPWRRVWGGGARKAEGKVGARASLGSLSLPLPSTRPAECPEPPLTFQARSAASSTPPQEREAQGLMRKPQSTLF